MGTENSDVSCVVSGSLALVLRASRALAMSPLSATRARAAWRVAPSRVLAFLQGLLMTAINLTAAAGLVWEFHEEPRKRPRLGETAMRSIVFITDNLLMLVTASIAVYMGPSRVKNLIQVLKKLQQINFELKIQPPSSKSENMRSLLVTVCLVLSTILQISDVLYIVITAYMDRQIWQLMGPYSGYYYHNIVLVMIVLQWFYVADATHVASAALNRQLQQLRYANFKLDSKATLDELTTAQSVFTMVNNFTTQSNGDTDIPMYQSQAQFQIRRLALAYDRIGEVILQLTAYNGIIILLIVIVYSARLVISQYYLLLKIFAESNFDWLYTIQQISWNIFFVLNLLLIVEPCQWTQDQREHTQFLLSQLTLHLAPKYERLAGELDQFSKQVQLNNAKFLPMGIFTLSRPLVVTILGSGTTYLLIILQFEKISDQMLK